MTNTIDSFPKNVSNLPYEVGGKQPEVGLKMPENLDLQSAGEYMKQVIESGHKYFVSLRFPPLEATETGDEAAKNPVLVFDSDQLSDPLTVSKFADLYGKTENIMIHVNNLNLDQSYRFVRAKQPRSGVLAKVGDEEVRFEERMLQTGLESNPQLRDLISISNKPDSFEEKCKGNIEYQNAVAKWLVTNGETLNGQEALREFPLMIARVRQKQIEGFVNDIGKMQREHNEAKLGGITQAGKKLYGQLEDAGLAQKF